MASTVNSHAQSYNCAWCRPEHPCLKEQKDCIYTLAPQQEQDRIMKNVVKGYMVITVLALGAIAFGMACAAGAPNLPSALLQQKAWIPMIAVSTGITLLPFLVILRMSILANESYYNQQKTKWDNAKAIYAEHCQANPHTVDRFCE